MHVIWRYERGRRGMARCYIAPAVERVLVLNASYEPLNVCSLRRAHVLVWKGKAEVLEGKGGQVDVSLFDVLLAQLNYKAAAYLNGSDAPTRQPLGGWSS